LDYKLGRGDVIKLGRIKFNVKDYRTKFCGTSCKKEPKANHNCNNPEEMGEEQKQPERQIDALNGGSN
jgi:hypothetical protein